MGKCLMRSCISFACTALYASLIQDGLKAGDETLMGRVSATDYVKSHPED